MTTERFRVWDPAVRLFHWSVVALFFANAMVLDDDSRLHQWVGWAIVALVLLRLLWGLVGTRYARFSSFVPTPARALGQIADIATGRRRVHLGHTPLGALMIFNLLGVLLLIGLSGWMMTTDAYWGVEWVEELHEGAVLWAEVSVLLHVAAVVWESLRTRVNLPAAMVSGYKTIPSEARIEE